MLNEAQRSYLEAYFIGQYGVLTLIKDGLSAKDALSAFQCLLEMKDKNTINTHVIKIILKRWVY
ncbi:MAG: hypothetical protein HWD59_10125 [Coxiellaceae bacterium]|nr:MAG: hypothetical protein HWD59_10125 [Coxiellaceae bacterium]